MSQLPFEKVASYDEISPLLEDYYNEPVFSPEFTEDDFEAEYSAAYLRVFECLEAAEAAMPDLAEEAFSMEPEMSPSRSLGMVIHRPDLLSTDLLHRLWAIIQELPQEYVIAIEGNDRKGGPYCITLTKHEVMGYAEDPEPLAALGFP